VSTHPHIACLEFHLLKWSGPFKTGLGPAPSDGDSGLPWMMLVGLGSDLRIERGVDALTLKKAEAEADMNVMFEDLEVDCMNAAEVPVVMIYTFEVDAEGDREGSLGSVLG
jgi:hypothetical protein